MQPPLGTERRLRCRQPLFRRELAENSHATPTPVTDGNLVYAAFNGGRVMAVDFQGNIAWDWQDKEFVSKHGLAVSPILYRDKLIMPLDGNGPADPVNIGFRTAWDGAFIVALDKHTGQEKWRAKRGLSRQAHVTPMVVEVNGRPQLISGAGDVVQGFDPDGGQRLWTVRSPGEGVVPSIVYGQGIVFTSSGYGSPAIRAIRLDGHDDVTATHIAWESRANVPLMPSFVYLDGLLLCIKESGVATCLDAKTGEVVWKERLGGTYGASPVLAEGRVYCLAEDGTTTVIAAGREFKQLAKNPLEGLCKASPAISGGRIFIRSQSSLFCVRGGAGSSTVGGLVHRVSVPSMFALTRETPPVYGTLQAQFTMAHTRGWAANSPNSRIRLKADLDRARQEIALLREELRIHTRACEQVSRLRAVRGPAAEVPLSDAGEGENCPDPGPSRSPSRRDHSRTHAQGEATTSAVRQGRRNSQQESGGRCEVSWPLRAHRLDRSSHLAWLLDYLVPVYVTAIWPFAWWISLAEDHFFRRVMGYAVFLKEPSSTQVFTAAASNVGVDVRASSLHGMGRLASMGAWRSSSD